MSQFDVKVDKLYSQIDDCGLGFIDSVSLGRFMKKCGVIPSKELLISIIRRFDLDSDAKLSRKEFINGLIPIERFTKSSLG